jgi:hypothetical protein
MGYSDSTSAEKAFKTKIACLFCLFCLLLAILLIGRAGWLDGKSSIILVDNGQKGQLRQAHQGTQRMIEAGLVERMTDYSSSVPPRRHMTDSLSSRLSFTPGKTPTSSDGFVSASPQQHVESQKGEDSKLLQSFTSNHYFCTNTNPPSPCLQHYDVRDTIKAANNMVIRKW